VPAHRTNTEENDVKHQWKTDGQGKVKPRDEYADHPVAECLACGDSSGCLDAIEQGAEYCNAIGIEPALDADDCEGLDLTVEVQVIIRHPGKATIHNDRSLVAQGWQVPLEQLVDGQADIVELEIRHLAAAMVNQWHIAKAAHLADWQRAIEARS
jgi:hypothetical protein